MAYIGNSPANVGNYQVVDDISSSFNGTLTSFALTASSLAITPAKSGQLLVSINGVLQEPDDTGTDGFKVSGSNIVFSSAPASGSTFWCVYQGQNVDIGTPSDGTVGTAQMSSSELELTGNLSLGDNVKATFGASDDLQIYHDGTRSLIKDAGTGDLLIRATNLKLQNADGTTYLNGTSGASVDLYHNNSKKLSTTNTGIDITGAITTDGITEDSSGNVGIGTSSPYTNGMTVGTTDAAAIISSGGANTHMTIATCGAGGAFRVFTQGGTTYNRATGESMRIDSTGNVGIGTSSPSVGLQVGKSTSGQTKTVIFNSEGGGEVGLTVQSRTNRAKIRVADNDTSAYVVAENSVAYFGQTASASTNNLAIDSSGNVGIGTSSPSTKLEVNGTVKLGNGVTQSAPSSSDIRTTAHTYLGGTGGNGVFIGQYPSGTSASSYASWLQSSFQTPSTATYDLVLNPLGGNVGIGTSSPLNEANKTTLDLAGAWGGQVNISVSGVEHAQFGTDNYSSGLGCRIESKDGIVFKGTGSAERMRIDSSGKMLVAKSSSATNATGVELQTGVSGHAAVVATATSQFPLLLNRKSSDGDIIQFRKDNSIVGGIGVGGGDLYIRANGNNGVRLLDAANSFIPSNNAGGYLDNVMDLGYSTARWDDVRATNGTIQTSDRNEKQDIEELTATEERVAVACKSLMRKFRWKSAFEAKGDDARIHFGIIAQDLQDAFAVEGLDAGRYAMFISDTWYEKEVEVPAVEAVDAVYETVVTTPAVEAQDAEMGERQVMETIETGTYVNLAGETITETQEVGVTEEATETVIERQDIDGVMTEVEVERTVNVPVMETYEVSPAIEAVTEVTEEQEVSEAIEAKDAYTRTDTEDEPTEGYTERTRLGVRYPELLAFIISAI